MTRYLLDTVTISELRRDDRKMHPGVRDWQSDIGEVWLSVITLNELRYGMQKVAKKDRPFASILAAWYGRIITQSQRFHILQVNRAIAEQAADFRAAFDTPFEDSLIAATAKVHRLTLATRNTSDFQDCGIKLLSPWEYQG